MAHEIEINNGVASYAENGRKERAWHKLGQVFDGRMTVEEALTLSHADYEVQMQPVAALTPEIIEAMGKGEKIEADSMLSLIIPNRKATMRMDKQKSLGVVSDSYGVVQNADAFKFIDTLCTGQTGNDHTPVIESAGVLGNGERVFITAKFPDQIILDNKTDDRVDMYVVFTTSHDGTGAVNCMVTPTRVVCNNTLNFAMRHNLGKLSLRHSSNIMKRLDLSDTENAQFAFKTLHMYEVYKNSLEESFERLRNIRLAERDLDRILAEVLYSEANFNIYKATGDLHHADITTIAKNTFDRVKNTLHSGVGQDIGERGTGMWAINGLTSYYQNEANYTDDEYKFDSITHGFASRKVQEAFELITA